MSEIINNQNAWSKFKSLAQQVIGTNDINDADLKKLLSDSDTNGDGLFSLDELKNALTSYEEYMALEEEFIEVFNAIAKEDGESSSISEQDITSAINGAQEGADVASENDAPSGGNGPSGGPSGGGPKPDPTKGGNEQDSISRSDLEGKDINTLQNEKNGVLNDISSVRDEKATAIAGAEQKTKSTQEEYENATKNFDDLIKTQEETEESAQKASDKVQELNTQKSDKNSEISTQEGVVSDATTLVSTINSSLNSLQEPPQYIYETVTNSDGTTSTIQKDNPAYAAYLAQKAALEAQLADAEADLAEQEKLLSSLESELTVIEKNHQQAVEDYCQIKEQLGQLTPELAEAQKAIQSSKSEYDKAQTEEAQVASQFDKQIETLRNNLGVYSDVIQEKELTLPEGYSIINGQIVGGEGENQHTLKLSSEADLPEGAKIDANNIIRDANGNEIGRILGAEGSNPQVYIKEPPPLEPELIDMCVDILLNGHNLDETFTTAEEVWTDIKGNGLDLQEINSTDLAAIREAYNQRVELHNAHETEEKLKTFDEMAEAMLKESKPEAFKHVQGAIKNADEKDAQEKTFSEYIKENGVDVATTSQIILDKYLNDFIKEQTGTEAKYDLSDEKIDEVVSSLLNGAQKNGEPISASELLQNYDFDSISTETIAKIVQQYNEKSETNFADSIDTAKIGEQELSHITDSLIKSLNSNDENMQISSQETLNKLIDKTLSENNTVIIDSIINAAKENLPAVQKLISDNNLISKIDTSNLEDSLKTDLKGKIEEINKKETQPKALGKFNNEEDVLAIAHRGFSSEAPENTLAAIELAKANGYNAVELDIAWTKDGIPVLLHDSTIGRTSDGPNSAKCSDMTYQDLLKYDFGSWAGEQFAGTKIPTFSEALDCCADNKMEFFAELKDTKDFTYEKAQELVNQVIEAGMQENITWISFDKNALAMIDKAMDDANLSSSLGYLTRDSVNNNTIKTLNELKDDNNEVFLDIKAANLTASGAQKLNDAGYEYGVWTVNSEKDVERLADLGCSAITTDKLTQDDIEFLL